MTLMNLSNKEALIKKGFPQIQKQETSQVKKTSIGRALGRGLDLLDMLQMELPLLSTKDVVVAELKLQNFPFELSLPAPSNTLANL